MPPRLFVDQPLRAGPAFSLPPGPARHVQVLRLQPGAALTLFNGTGGEWHATVTQMGRSDVQVQLHAHDPVDRELQLGVTLALGMPANERMDTLVEKATELGAAVIQPLVCQRSVLRLSDERAQKKVAHWQAVAVAACEQCGRTRVPRVAPVLAFGDWLARQVRPGGGAERDEVQRLLKIDVQRDTQRDVQSGMQIDMQSDACRITDHDLQRIVLSFAGAPAAESLASARPAGVLCLSGPEGGLTESEEAAALAAGFTPLSLGARVLRADTAPLALLAHLALSMTGSIAVLPGLIQTGSASASAQDDGRLRPTQGGAVSAPLQRDPR